jgi:hypothetical protein
MLTETHYLVPEELIEIAQHEFIEVDFKLAINQPTGDFYYDPWEIKPEFEDTVWDELLYTLPLTVGEARLIKLGPGEAYRRHTDMDDRYHLNISGDFSYLIDLDKEKMYPTNDKSRWYMLDAGVRHSAVNFNRVDRLQLVVRQLLLLNVLNEPVNVSITGDSSLGTMMRYYFDNTVSRWLNTANKKGYITKFTSTETIATFDVERERLEELITISEPYFHVCIN